MERPSSLSHDAPRTGHRTRQRVAERDVGATVIDRLFVGPLTLARSAEWCELNNIQAIVNASGSTYKTDIPVFMVMIDDNIVTNENIGEYIFQFGAGMIAIREAMNRGVNVLVHCHAGINRSITLIGFYLLELGYTYHEVVNLLATANRRRGVPCLTNGYFQFLLQARAGYILHFDGLSRTVAEVEQKSEATVEATVEAAVGPEVDPKVKSLCLGKFVVHQYKQCVDVFIVLLRKFLNRDKV